MTLQANPCLIFKRWRAQLVFSLLQWSLLPRLTPTTRFLCLKEKEKKEKQRKKMLELFYPPLESLVWAPPPLLQLCVTWFSLMNCKKTKTNVITRVPNILKRQKAFWFLFPCALSPCTGMLGVSFLLFIGVLLRLASCLFCMVFAKKCLLREESLTILFYFISFGLFATLDLKRSPPPAPSFLSSVFCMLHLEPAHRAISPMYNKELFLCLLSFLGLVSWVLAVHLTGMRRWWLWSVG